jgi:hypothetical protein
MSSKFSNHVYDMSFPAATTKREASPKEVFSKLNLLDRYLDPTIGSMSNKHKKD